MEGEREALGRDLEGGESVTPTYSEALEARAEATRAARDTFDEMIPRILKDHYGLEPGDFVVGDSGLLFIYEGPDPTRSDGLRPSILARSCALGASAGRTAQLLDRWRTLDEAREQDGDV